MSNVWIKTQPSADGSTYVVTIEASDDRAITLTPDGSLRYASTVLGAVARAEHDAAIFRQLGAKVGKHHAGLTIRDMRRDRPPLNDEATAPLRIEPGVTSEGEPFLTIHLDGEALGEWTPEGAREHALVVLEAVTVADLDSAYYRALTSMIGLDEPTARNVVDDLGRWRVDE